MSSAICQYVCQSVLFVQPIRSFNLISMLVHCLHMKITTCLLVFINQLRKLENSFSCELFSSLSACESCLIYLEQSCQSYMIPMIRLLDLVNIGYIVQVIIILSKDFVWSFRMIINLIILHFSESNDINYHFIKTKTLFL